MHRLVRLVCCATTVAALAAPAAAQNRQIGINVVLNRNITPQIVADLAKHGSVLQTFVEIEALTMRAADTELAAIRSLPYVAAAGPDVEREGTPIDTVGVSNFAAGFSTWNLDAVDVSNPGQTRSVAYDGSGVYVAVIDTGLLDS